METKKIAQKLLEFQTNIETIKKDGSNSFFKKPNGKASTYATLPHILSEVKPILNALKLVVTQPIAGNEVYTIITDTETGETANSSIVLPAGLNAQQTGSAITYYRRYTLCSLLALEIDEDDDGNAASQPKKEQPKAEQPKEQTLYLNKGTETYTAAVENLRAKKVTMEQIKKKYKISPETEKDLIEQSKKELA
jgi:hypothetical protein